MPEIIPNFDQSLARKLEAPDTTEIKEALTKEIKGQDQVIEAWAGILHRVLADTPKLRKGPLAVLTEIGPSGVGKTEIAIQAARFLASHSKKSQTLGIEDEKPSILRIDCGEYQQEHEVSKVIGSPLGYVGHDATPRLAQAEVDKYAIQIDEKRKVTILLLDEIEKAHQKLNITFLGGLDYGVITLGNNKKTSLENCIVVFTSNLGNKEIAQAEDGDDTIDEDGKRKIRLDAMREHFSPEQLSRMGGETNTVLFNELSREVVSNILISKLDKLEREYAKHGRNLTFQITQGGLEKLLDMGYSAREGARRLEIVLEQQITSRLTTLEKSKTKTPVVIDAEGEGIALYIPKPEEKSKEEEEPPIKTDATKAPPKTTPATERKSANGGEKIEVVDSNDPSELLQGYTQLVNQIAEIGASYKEALRKQRYPKDANLHSAESNIRDPGRQGNLNYFVQKAFKEAAEAGSSTLSREAVQEALKFYYNRMGWLIIEKIKASNKYHSEYQRGQDIDSINYKFRRAVNEGSPDMLIEEFQRQFRER